MKDSGDKVRDIGRGESDTDEWILTQSRATVLDGLVADGLTRQVAEMWCDMWELQWAANLAPIPEGYWQAGKEWIDVQRGADRRSAP
jgi:hypothetical protein